MKTYMKKEVLFVLSLALFGFTQADTLSYFKAMADSISDDVSEGSVEARSFDLKAWSLEKEVAAVDQEMNSEDSENTDSCRFDVSGDLASNLKHLKNGLKFNSEYSKVIEVVEKLQAEDNLLAVVNSDWDANSGDSEYCSTYRWVIFSKDGAKLDVTYSWID